MLIALLPLTEIIAAEGIVRRAAFDIGSGQVKMQIADLDLGSDTLVSVLLNENVRIPIREDLDKSLDETISPDFQDRLVSALAGLMEKAEPYLPSAYHAVATEALRLAKNGPQIVEKIKLVTGLTVTIVTQEEEGVLGFVAAVAEAGIDPDSSLVWDQGGGSLQFTIKEGDTYQVYQSKLGKVPFKRALLSIQGRDRLSNSPNPISKDEFQESLAFIKEQFTDFPEGLKQKLKSMSVLRIGIHPLWGISDKNCFDKEGLLQLIEEYLTLNDEQICQKNHISPALKETATFIVVNLILAYGIMETLGIDTVRYVGTSGALSTGAMLTPHYWK